MAEHRKSRDTQIPERLRPLMPLLPLFLVLVTAILLWGRGESAEEEETLYLSLVTEESVPRLVTAEQLERMAYIDSNMGEVGWVYTEQSLAELNRVLQEYEILTPEEISQFLAQAAVETAAGRWLTELGDEAYFQRYGYSTGTRGAGYLHLTFEYGQMAFATWMMKKYIPELGGIPYRNPTCNTREDIADAYYSTLRLAANLGVDISRYSRIVYDSRSPVSTGADYIAEAFAWESAGYYWHITGIGCALDGPPGVRHTDDVSRLVGGGNWQSRREAYMAFYPVLNGSSKDEPIS
ncbi:MAG: hypothetical protein HFF73_00100 [Oscillospiraceae bacterium]|nr:hypothetical protein [Oscillospiraceae bacterium]